VTEKSGVAGLRLAIPGDKVLMGFILRLWQDCGGPTSSSGLMLPSSSHPSREKTSISP
jgi:hypothetical protein